MKKLYKMLLLCLCFYSDEYGAKANTHNLEKDYEVYGNISSISSPIHTGWPEGGCINPKPLDPITPIKSSNTI